MEEIRDKVFKRKHGYYIIDEKYYEMVTKEGESFLQYIPEEEYNEHFDTAKEIVDDLYSKLSDEQTKTILMEAVMRLSPEDLKILRELLYEEDEIEVREHHCVDIKVKNFVFPIISG